MRREFTDRQHRYLSDYESYLSGKNIKNLWREIFTGKDQGYVEIFDFITFLVRDDDFPKAMIPRIAAALDKPYCPYRLSVSARTIYPAIGAEETLSLEKDLEEAFRSPFAGSKTHLQTALQLFGEGDYRATVRESIHAVESAVKDFTEDRGAILSKATKTLASQFGVHKALTDAFDKLYAYTNDEKGIRHALVFEDNKKVGFDEAVFFLSACTAFIGFLSRKKNGQSV